MQRNNRKSKFLPKLLAVSIASVFTCSTMAQEATNTEEKVEKISVVGSHIKGGAVAEALAVSVISAEDIGILGIDSIDDLLQLIPENGQNFFSESQNIGGGVNAARGDIGTYNLRNLGTGNTLVLLNGRRMVNSASYQTEEVGGSFVPVNSVNVNTIPVNGLNRVEVLRDGASAIYGADAVAGVVNHVMKSDFVGFTLTGRWTEFENLPRDTQTITAEWGKDFNGGRTNISTFLNYYKRERVNAQDDPRWANADFSDRVPVDSPWFGDAAFRNDSANSLFGQFDVVSSASAAGLNGIFTDNAGEFETYPIGDPRCQYTLNATTCGGRDGQGTFRDNLNANRDLSSELTRSNAFIFVNHEFQNGVESFTELSFYEAKTNLLRHGASPFATSALRVGAENYYNPFGPCGSPNRLDSALIPNVPCTGLELIIDNYRFSELPRIVDNDSNDFRILQGFRGEFGDWSWESAFAYSKAQNSDITRNRVSNILITEALFDSTPAAYNPFSGGLNSNIERALVDVERISETELTTFDIKFAHPEIYTLPAGPVGMVVGFEYRNETFLDDRDDRLDGTITFTDFEGDTYPFVSDVVNSSPTPDNSGERDVTSLFAELQIPVLETLNVQVAMRYEDFSDVEATTVGKIAFGWRPSDMFLLRGSWSEAYRAPNLVTINESIVARNNTRTDYACLYAAENGGDPNQNTLDCTNSIQRIAEGSDTLAPEESTNTSFGFVLTPLDGLTITADYWSIKKENTIGLFGEENHTLLDLILRLEQGTSNCSSATFNPAVSRAAASSGASAVYLAAGICPAGDIRFVDDQYLNLNTRNLAGFDVGLYYDIDTSAGDFKFSYNGSFIDKYEQEAGGDASILVAAQEAGQIPSGFPVAGFADLIGQDGNQEQRHSMRLSWRLDSFGASLSGNRIGSFYQSSLTLEDGTRYIIPSMTTFNATLDYRVTVNDVKTRIRLGAVNLTDERAPLADGFFGFFADAHRDFGRSYYVDVQARF
ncbi:TonB-dependent receptor domain-containing protein [Glaciecola sp. SC05]|uniref:TonB-dependent receptor domain-containing protein n=1 Tax=Glaciecola sp. SC05 TaxID=1987355 RepID=UPI003528259F